MAELEHEAGTVSTPMSSRVARGDIMSEVVVVIGPGQIGQAIARRVGVGKQVLP